MVAAPLVSGGCVHSTDPDIATAESGRNPGTDGHARLGSASAKNSDSGEEDAWRFGRAAGRSS
jgi:hypothetical protein